jgi:aarF domain-containing kinase
MLCFPKVYYESEDLLIERYVENSHDIEQYFSKFGDEKLRKRLALIGLNSFFRMFIFDNFIHADCHAGNLLVQKCQL